MRLDEIARAQARSDATKIAELEAERDKAIAERDRLRVALRQTVDLCNAMREYAPALNMEAERTLREALRAGGPKSS